MILKWLKRLRVWWRPEVPSFSLNTSEGEGATIVTVCGDLDVYSSPKLRDELVRLKAHGRHWVVVDLQPTATVDSTGLGALVGGLRRFRADDGDLMLVCPNRNILKVFELTGLVKVFTIYETVEDAVDR